jgi:hypothetical protein
MIFSMKAHSQINFYTYSLMELLEKIPDSTIINHVIIPGTDNPLLSIMDTSRSLLFIDALSWIISIPFIVYSKIRE